MKTVLSCAVLSCAVLSGASAQSVSRAPDGGSSEHLQSISILPKTDAPFSATVVTTWTRVLEDGTRTTVKNHRTVARDSTGRIFEERRFFAPDGDTQETRLSRLEYSDPIRHEFMSCDPVYRVCLVSNYNAPASVTVTVAPTVTLPNGKGSIRTEPLGQSTMEDVEVNGSREITTINPGSNGYQQPEPTVKEFWYSPRLEINLVVKRFEPRGGQQNFTVENLNLSEPDPRFFTPPADYKIVHTSRY